MHETITLDPTAPQYLIIFFLQISSEFSEVSQTKRNHCPTLFFLKSYVRMTLTAIHFGEKIRFHASMHDVVLAMRMRIPSEK